MSPCSGREPLQHVDARVDREWGAADHLAAGTWWMRPRSDSWRHDGGCAIRQGGQAAVSVLWRLELRQYEDQHGESRRCVDSWHRRLRPTEKVEVPELWDIL